MRPIWNYATTTTSEHILHGAWSTRSCPCCADTTLLEVSDASSQSDGGRYTEQLDVRVCPACGWWLSSQAVWDSSCGSVPDEALHIVSASGAALTRFAKFPDAVTLDTLRAEVQEHLKSKGMSSQWAAMEDATAAILHDFGYMVRVTQRSKDGGIDVVAEHPVRGMVFVQVKHSRNKVGVQTLRELIGTAFVGGVNAALLVTSSDFTVGVTNAAVAANERGLVVELIDGERFLSALELTQRMTPPSLRDVLPLATPSVEIVRTRQEL